MTGRLPQPLRGGGPLGVADIEANFKRTRFLPGLSWLLRQRGADVTVTRRVKSPAPLVVGAPETDQLAKAARDLYGSRSGLAPARPAAPATVHDVDQDTGDISFLARVLLIDDSFTESDALFASDFSEQRCISSDDLHPGDVFTYLRDDGRHRSYEVTSAPMVLGGTTELLRQFTIAPSTD